MRTCLLNPLWMAWQKIFHISKITIRCDTIRYDTRCYFNVRSKADISQLNLPHGKTGTNINSLFSVDLQPGIYADKTAIEQTFTSKRIYCMFQFFRAPVCIHVGETTFLESIIASSPRQRHAAGIKTLFSGGRARRWCRRAGVSSSVVVRVVLVTSSLYSDVIKWRQTSSSRIINVMRRRMTVAIWRAQHPHLPSTWAAVPFSPPT